MTLDERKRIIKEDLKMKSFNKRSYSHKLASQLQEMQEQKMELKGKEQEALLRF